MRWSLQSYRHICAYCQRPFTSSAEGWLSHKKDDGSNDFESDKDHEPEYSDEARGREIYNKNNKDGK